MIKKRKQEKRRGNARKERKGRSFKYVEKLKMGDNVVGCREERR